ncbi:MAG: hypothetical protein AAF674_22630 [Pseudomonadota bacterium]
MTRKDTSQSLEDKDLDQAQGAGENLYVSSTDPGHLTTAGAKNAGENLYLSGADPAAKTGGKGKLAGKS